MTLLLSLSLVSVLGTLQKPVVSTRQDAKLSLPITSITFDTSGVSFTQRSGLMDGAVFLSLSFQKTQINDVLKSLFLVDTKGNVHPVLLTTKDPAGKTLQSIAVDVTQPLERAELLSRLPSIVVRITVEPRGLGGDGSDGHRCNQCQYALCHD